MADCVDWLATLRPASLGGVPFFVESDDVTTGRRLAVHEFPHRDTPYVEDLGQKANTISVRAYVVGDNVGSQEQALRSVCGGLGPWQLSVPMGRFLVHVESCSRNFSRDQLGYIAFDIQCVRHGSTAAPFPVGALLRAIEFGLSEIKAPLAIAFAATYVTVRLPSHVAEAGAARIREFAVALEDGRRRTPTSGAAASEWREALTALYDDATSLAVIGAAGNTWTTSSVASSATESPADDLVDAIWEVAAFPIEAAAADDAERMLRAHIEFGVDWEPVTATTAARAQEAANDEAIGALMRVAVLAHWVEAMARRTYTDRRAGRQALADIAEYIDNELSRLTVWQQYDVYRQIVDLRKQAVAYFQRLITDLAPVLTIEASQRMPSLYWAGRLYDDATRAEEIANRNLALHPSFIPATFEALGK